MKKILFSIALLYTMNANAQTTAIPDANFEQALIDLGIESGVPDGVILTSQIDTVTSLNVAMKNILNMTGIEGFIAMTDFDCRSNQLTSLDISQNTALTDCVCSYNQLTSLNVSSNTALTSLECADNQLTSLDVSQNIGLTFLGCWSNELTSLDLSQNIALIILDSPFNQLICLNVKNGNNANFLYFDVRYNPNLTCVEVDNALWSTANWTNIDSQTSYSQNCNNACSGNLGIEVFIKGTVELVKITDLMGRDSGDRPNTALIYIYSDGTTEKIFRME